MEKKIYLLLLAVSALFFVACDPDDGPDGPSANTNYWDQTSWVKMQLKSKVKTLTEVQVWSTDESTGHTSTIEFNEQGWITQMMADRAHAPATQPTVFQYENGQLVNDGENTYTYASHGKYIPRQTFHIKNVGLARNLASVTSAGGNNGEYGINCIFNNDTTLYFINWSMYNEERYEDTTIFIYEDKYPVKFLNRTDTWGEFMNASYQANGMFDVYEEGFLGFEEGGNAYTYRDSRKTYYKQDDLYLLEDRYENNFFNYENPESNSTRTTSYVYNDKKDLVREESMEDMVRSELVEYAYEYDEKGNWTKRTSTATYGENEPYTITTTRTIVYY